MSKKLSKYISLIEKYRDSNLSFDDFYDEFEKKFHEDGEVNFFTKEEFDLLDSIWSLFDTFTKDQSLLLDYSDYYIDEKNFDFKLDIYYQNLLSNKLQ